MRSKLSNRSSLMLAAVVLAVPLAAVLLLGAGDERESRREQNRREIERMTPAQRARLERNFQAFRKMPEEERDAYREMHRQLRDDPNAAALRQTMLRYQSWLQTLSPFQREQLRQTPDVKGRMELVRRFKAEQSTPARLSEGEPRLSHDDLAAMMNVVAAELELPPEELAGMPELERHLHILRELFRAKRDERRFRGWTSLFEGDLIDKMIAALPPGEFREAIAEVRRFKEAERRIVVGNIFESLRKDVSAKVESTPPTPDDLRRILERLSFDDRRRYGSLESEDERNQFLADRFRRWQMFEVLKEYPELRPLFFQWPSYFPRDRNGSRRRFGSRQGGGRDSERGSSSQTGERPESPDDSQGGPDDRAGGRDDPPGR